MLLELSIASPAAGSAFAPSLQIKDRIEVQPLLAKYMGSKSTRCSNERVVPSIKPTPKYMGFGSSHLIRDGADVQDDETASAKMRLGKVFYFAEEDRLSDLDGNLVVLRAQSAHVLRILTERRGTLVPREEIFAQVWAGLAVTDDSLTQCIADIRKAIGDGDRTILQTVPKRGFILQAARLGTQSSGVPVAPGFAEQGQPFKHASGIALSIDETRARKAGAGTSDRVLDGIDSGEAIRQSWHVARDLGTAVGLDVATGDHERSAALAQLGEPGEVLATVDFRDATDGNPELDFEDLGDVGIDGSARTVRAFRVSENRPDLALRPQLSTADVLPTVAVIPLRPSDPHDRDGTPGVLFADEMTRTLGRSTEINVTSRLSSSVFQMRDSGLAEIGALLGAEFVLSGLFARRDDRVVLSIEFAEVRSQRVLWSDRIETGAVALMGPLEPATEIVSKIRKAIVVNEIKRVHTKPLDTLESYSILFGAVGMMHRLSPADFFYAQRLLEMLSERTPNHPIPLAWMARWRVLRVMQGWSEEPESESRRALEYTARALDLDPENTLALVSEGQVLTHLARRMDEAEDRYNTALEINANDAHGRILRGMLRSFQDRGAEGKRDAERALHLAPLDPHRFFFLALAAGANLADEDYERAVVLAEASLRLNRTHTSTLRMLAAAYAGAGREEHAKKTVQELIRLQPDLTVSGWLRSSPSANYRVGQRVATALRSAGLPD